MDYTLTIKLADGNIQNFPLPAIGKVVIGREAPADFVLGDSFLSRTHLELQAREGIFSLKDLNSRNGTLVNGVAVVESDLCHGDVLFAGSSIFRLSAMLNNRIGAPLLSATPNALPTRLAVLCSTIQSEFPFAIVDAAVSPNILELLKRSGSHFQSLYEGPAAVELAPDGPFLIDLVSSSILVPHLLQAGWGCSWGVFLKSSLSFVALRHQLRRWLTVEQDTGRKLLFRFYDPRVLAPFIRSSLSADRAAFFGDIREFLIESSNPCEVWILKKEADRDQRFTLAESLPTGAQHPKTISRNT